MKSYFIPALVLTLCSLSSLAMAGDKKGHLFGKDPVIFESSISHGWMADTSDQGLIANNASALTISDPQAGFALYGGIFRIIDPGFDDAIEHDAPRLSARFQDAPVFTDGFSTSTELSFGIRSAMSKSFEGIIRTNYSRLKSSSSTPQNFSINATAQTPFSGLVALDRITGELIRRDPIIGAGQFSQNFSASGTAAVSFSKTDIYSFEIGGKKKFLTNTSLAGIKAQPYVEATIGLAYHDDVFVETVGQLPDFTQAIQPDLSRVFLTPFVSFQGVALDRNDNIPTTQISRSTLVAKSGAQPTFALAAGLEFEVLERTSLGIEARYRNSSIRTVTEDHPLKLDRVTLSLRLSQSF